MTTWQMVLREILHRKVSFAAGVLSVVIAVSVLVAELDVLADHDRNTAAIIARKQIETSALLKQSRLRLEAKIAKLNDDMRKITKAMGFNVFIMPKDQDLSDFYAQGYASKFMSESYVDKLAATKIITVRHLLAILEQKIKWPEQGGRTIVLVGTRGEAPLAHRKPTKPITQPVARGQIVLGHELWKTLSLEKGSKIELLGRSFVVVRLHRERGTKDDITAWIHLSEAQELLGLQGRISAILALECSCAWADLAKVRREITRILPETQVRELYGKALARAEARTKAAQRGQADLRDEKRRADESIALEAAHRASLRADIEKLAAIVIPLAIVGCAAWVAMLSYVNVRRRRAEVGILRAIGTRSGRIAAIFLVRAALVGGAGAVLGCAAGVGLAAWAGEGSAGAPAALAGWGVLVAALVGAPCLCAFASLAPAMLAAGQDPADILREE